MFSYRRDFYKLLTVDSLVWMSMAAFSAFINAYYTQNNISSFHIGILSAIGPISCVVFQPFWARLSDHTGRQRSILQMVAVCAGGCFLIYLAGNTFFIFLIATVAMQLFNSAILPLTDAIITKEAREKRVNFAIVRIGGTVGFAIMVFGVGQYLNAHPAHMFVISAIMYTLFSISCFLLPRNVGNHAFRAQQAQQPVQTGWKRFRLDAVFEESQIALVLGLAFIIYFGLSFHSYFMPVYVTGLGYDKAMLGILSSISAMSEVPVLLVIQKVRQRMSTLKLLCIALFMVALRILLVAVGWLPCIVFAQVLQGPTYMVTYYSCVTYISEHVKPGKDAQGLSILTMVQMGLASVSSSLIGGGVSNIVGLHTSFFLFAALMGAAAIGSTFALKYASKHKVQDAEVRQHIIR